MVSARHPRWWIDGQPGGPQPRQLELALISTRGLMTSQTVLVDADGSPRMLDEHCALAVEANTALGYGGSWPDGPTLAGLVRAAQDAIGARGALRLDVGLALQGSLRVADASVVVSVAAADDEDPLDPLDSAVDLAVASAPVVVTPPLAGYPLAMDAERTFHLRAAHAAACADVVLLDLDGCVVDLGAASLFVERDGVLLTPAASHGAVRTPVRRTVVERASAVETDVLPGDSDGWGAAFVLTRGGLVRPVRAVGGSALGESARPLEALRAAAADATGGRS